MKNSLNYLKSKQIDRNLDRTSERFVSGRSVKNSEVKRGRVKHDHDACNRDEALKITHPQKKGEQIACHWVPLTLGLTTVSFTYINMGHTTVDMLQ